MAQCHSSGERSQFLSGSPGCPERATTPSIKKGYDHRSYPPGRPVPGLLLRCCFPQVRPSVVPPPGRPVPRLLLRCCFPQVRPSVVPPSNLCPGCCSDAALHRYDHRSYPRQTSARTTVQMPLSAGTTIGRTCFLFPTVWYLPKLPGGMSWSGNSAFSNTRPEK